MRAIDEPGGEAETGKMRSSHQLLLLDSLQEIRELAIEARESSADPGSPERTYQQGRFMAFLEVLSLFYQNTRAFGLPLDGIGLGPLDPESELLS